jgi:hypothetical protein
MAAYRAERGDRAHSDLDGWKKAALLLDSPSGR